jgi:NAD-dependent deacetylase
MAPISSALVEHLRASEHILIFTGAGISTPSGIPDFRGPGGKWTREQPVYYDAFMSSEVARRAYWKSKAADWDAYRDAKPNAVHQAVADLERAGKDVTVATQNIDGLHLQAGTSPDRLIELHGTLRAVECQSCHQRRDPQPCFDAFRETGIPPVCSCGGWLKPATISFGQALRAADLESAQQAAQAADLVVALGSTLSVYPAAGIPLLAARRGTPYIIINRGATEHDDFPGVTLRLEGDVIDIFPPAVRAALE